MTGYTVRCVREAIKALERKKYLRIQHRSEGGKKISNLYYPNADLILLHANQRGGNNVPVVGNDVPVAVGNDVPIKRPNRSVITREKTEQKQSQKIESATTHPMPANAPLASSDGLPAVAIKSPPPVPQRGKPEGGNLTIGKTMSNTVLSGFAVCRLCHKTQPEKEFPVVKGTKSISDYCRSCWRNRKPEVLSSQQDLESRFKALAAEQAKETVTTSPSPAEPVLPPPPAVKSAPHQEPQAKANEFPAKYLNAHCRVAYYKPANRWEVTDWIDPKCGIPIGFGNSKEAAIAKALALLKRIEPVIKQEELRRSAKGEELKWQKEN
jgi:hypothetical protein